MATKHRELNRLLGIKEIKHKPLIEAPPHFPKPFPWRSYALGKGGNSTQGVAGWRNNYHRPDQPVVPAKVYLVKYDEAGNPIKVLVKG